MTLRDNSLNLLVVFVMLVFVFGCVCNTGDEEGDAGDGNARRPQPVQNDAPTGNKKGGKSTKPNVKSTDVSKKSEQPDSGDFTVEYLDVEDARYEKMNREMRDEKVMETAARDLNKTLSLPHDITLVTRDCGMINAFYKPSERSITICYELMDFYYNLFRQNGENERDANRKMSDTMQFIFLHELGHALIDAYKLSVLSNEEDAADRLATYINIEELGESGSRAAISAAEAFNLQSKLSGDKKLPFYDEHLLDQQRFYNILCSLYGSNPGKYSVLVEENLLPEPRAVRCPNEYKQIVTSWESQLKPFRKQ